MVQVVIRLFACPKRISKEHLSYHALLKSNFLAYSELTRMLFLFTVCPHNTYGPDCNKVSVHS